MAWDSICLSGMTPRKTASFAAAGSIVIVYYIDETEGRNNSFTNRLSSCVFSTKSCGW
jgi:hypothetical protein